MIRQTVHVSSLTEWMVLTVPAKQNGV
jgi:hypothetical protein